jgi:hypothetical protein
MCVADASVTREMSAPAAGWSSSAARASIALAAAKAATMAADHLTTVPFGKPHRASIRGRRIAAAAGINRL